MVPAVVLRYFLAVLLLSALVGPCPQQVGVPSLLVLLVPWRFQHA
jgi:hypothetical protein